MNFIITILLSFLLTQVAIAQPFSLNKNIKPIELKLVPVKLDHDTFMNGKIVSKDFMQKSDTAYYFVKGAGIYQPAYFSYTSMNKTDETQIFLCKNNWKKPDQVAKLKDGKWSLLFKTEGSYGIMVVQKKSKVKYNLLAWIGNETKNISMPSPFKMNTKPQKK
jgi:hypothetical protein